MFDSFFKSDNNEFNWQKPGFKKLCELQLIEEHKDICWKYKVNLSTPVIQVSSNRSHYGEWSSATRIIKISEHLIRNFSWDCVINIFKHEIAHQIVTDVFQADHEVSHGESFQKACDMIACDGVYRLATGDLPESEKLWFDDDLPDEYEQVMKKIDKLLSLATSDNENEAMLAMNKAQELQEKYNLVQLSRLTEKNYHYKIIELKKKKTSLQEKFVAGILQEFYSVNIIHSTLFDAETECSLNTIEIIGTRENVANAEYIYHFLINKIDFLWKSYRKQTGIAGSHKRSYQYGLLNGFRKNLVARQTSHPEDSSDTKTLVATNERFLKAVTNRRFPRLRKSGGNGGRIKQDSYESGVSEGRKIVINKGVERKAGFAGRLLGS